MGCFSWKCLECGRGILSSSFSGEKAHLYLLNKGKILQQITGEYNSYGSVFIDGTQEENVKHSLRKSVEWVNPFPNIPYEDEEYLTHSDQNWHRICNMMDDEDITTGIAAIHMHCYKKPPETRSARDPNQGWGGGGEEDESYFGGCEGEGHQYKPQTPVPGYDARKDLRLEQLRPMIFEERQRITMSALFKATNGKGNVDAKKLESIISKERGKFDALVKEFISLGGILPKDLKDL